MSDYYETLEPGTSPNFLYSAKIAGKMLFHAPSSIIEDAIGYYKGLTDRGCGKMESVWEVFKDVFHNIRDILELLYLALKGRIIESNDFNINEMGV